MYIGRCVYTPVSGKQRQTITIMNEKMFKIFRSKKEVTLPKGTEGDYETDGKTFLKIACTNGYLHLLEIQLEGKKKMGVEEFLRGYRF